MNCFLLATLILTALGGMFALVLQFQMLQQNSYFPSRYTKWLGANLPTLCVLIFFLYSALFCLELYVWQTVLAATVLVFRIVFSVKQQKKSIKKLVFTGRIKRLFTAAFLILAVLTTLYALFPEILLGKISSVLCFMMGLITPFLVYISWAVTKPIENAFNKWYINDAKKILKQHKNLRVIGITGSYGKTSVKFILTRILSEKYNVVCTPHSFNTPMGVVRTIREMLKPQTEIFVCEMGAKKVGDIKEICDIVSPDIAIITSVGPQHLDTFKSLDNIFKTKFELAGSVKAKGGDVFVNADSKEISARIGNDFILYGTAENCDFAVSNVNYGRGGSKFDIKLGSETVTLSTRMLGIHNIINIAGAAGLAYSLGVATRDISYAVSALKPTEHRLEVKSSVNSSIMIDDAYNANPEGCLEAVRVLGSFEGMKKVIITPGLIELGEKEYDCNFALGLEAAKFCDIIIFVGKNRSKPMVDAVNTTNFNKDNMYVASSFFEAMDIYKKIADSNTVVLVENDLPDNYLN